MTRGIALPGSTNMVRGCDAPFTQHGAYATSVPRDLRGATDNLVIQFNVRHVEVTKITGRSKDIFIDAKRADADLYGVIKPGDVGRHFLSVRGLQLFTWWLYAITARPFRKRNNRHHRFWRLLTLDIET